MRIKKITLAHYLMLRTVISIFVLANCMLILYQNYIDHIKHTHIAYKFYKGHTCTHIADT